MPSRSPNFIASGNINPSVFVKVDPANNFAALQAGVGDQPVGVSQEGTRNPPGVLGSDGFAAHAGETLTVFGEGFECLLTFGGNVTAGDYLVPDASGRGITLVPATGLNKYGAQALESGVLGEKRRVVVMNGVFKSP